MGNLYLFFILLSFVLGAGIYRCGVRDGQRAAVKEKPGKDKPAKKPSKERKSDEDEAAEPEEEEPDKPSIEEQWESFLTFESKRNKRGKGE